MCWFAQGEATPEEVSEALTSSNLPTVLAAPCIADVELHSLAWSVNLASGWVCTAAQLEKGLDVQAAAILKDR